MRKVILTSRSLVILQVLFVIAEIWGSGASMLALILEAGAHAAVVTTILFFTLK